MNRYDFIDLIRNSGNISVQQMDELEKVVGSFPYCQAAHVLLAKAAHQNKSMLADQKLKKAAAYTVDRKNLKQIISGVTTNITPAVVMNIETATEATVTDFHPTKENATIALSPTKEKEPELSSEKTEVTPLTVKEEKVTPFTPLIKNREKFLEELENTLKEMREKYQKPATKENIVETIKPQTEEQQGISQEFNKIGIDSTEIENKGISSAGNTNENILTLSSQEDLPQTVLAIMSSDTPSVKEDNTSLHILDEMLAIESGNVEGVYSGKMLDVISDDNDTDNKALGATEADLFNDYLEFLNNKKSKNRKDPKKLDAIIDKFIKEDPSIPYLTANKPEEEEQEDLASKSYVPPAGLISENFAKILLKQGKKDKAIRVYEELILKNPEKRAYFVSLIEEIKNKI